MSAIERPSHGARFSFERVAVDGESARYVVRVVEAEREAEAEARVSPAALELGRFEGSIEPWAGKAARAFLEVIQRGYDAEAGWPRRVQRWRAQRV
jgi:hypothetical protein